MDNFLDRNYIIEKEHRAMIGENRKEFDKFSKMIMKKLAAEAKSPDEATRHKNIYMMGMEMAKDAFGKMILDIYCDLKPDDEEEEKKDNDEKNVGEK